VSGVDKIGCMKHFELENVVYTFM